jgi:hypothetical protein
MARVPIKPILATAVLSALLGGCATTIEAGPGYYHYDTRAAGSPPAVVYPEPGVTYREPTSAFHNPPVVVYDQPAFVYRSDRGEFVYHDRGQ